ncbi:glucose sorbosone dehydrogenase [Nocardioides gansuensis]|uniref:Glucose sorbosone dehydrogenase n=1 Tax=Nocardioides gansuensis TaxID=2138300 RepID=A0A2T8F6R6_9ACTN|nr:PQQ-dependent sugar dehydrogenase [Nocardioides gansuensis]PVG81403.1 glucose sorbosone dehydrogenase [Nocardioides gansuensis]
MRALRLVERVRLVERSRDLTLALAVALLLSACQDEAPDPEMPSFTQPTDATPSTPTDSPTSREPSPDRSPRVLGTVATDLRVPWGVAFLPDGTALVTERDTRRVFHLDGTGGGDQVGVVEQAAPEGEAGLLGIAVSPDYDSDQQVFLYATTAEDNRVLRAPYEDGRLGEPEPILTGIPKGFIHDGGRLAFGPDGFLYVSTGETGDEGLAQDRESLAGKILRITTDGDPAPGNPFGTPVWSWGHRNVQGLAFDDAGRLWASEFGAQSFDELNLIEPGANYGWPEVEGKGGEPDFVDPLVTWPTSEASPSGLAWTEGHLWLGALMGERLWRVDVAGRRASNPTPFFVGRYGRLRSVVAAPDGTLWVSTSNHDGRGQPAEGDDRILRIQP